MGRKLLIAAGLVLVVVAVIAASCKKVEKPESKGETTTTTKSAATSEKPPGEDEVALAEVDGDVITWEDLNEIYHIERMSNRLTREQVKRLLDNLVRERLVYLHGLEKGYDEDPEYIRKLERTKRKLIHRMAMEDLAHKRPEVGKKEMKKYYDKHPEAFRVSKVQYLMFSPRKFDNDRKKARVRAEKALEEIKGGMTMKEASKKFLEKEKPFTINMREGQASFFGHDFDRKVEKLEPGEVAGPLQGPQGFIVAKLLERETQSFRESRGYIRTLLNREKSSNRIKSYYERLRDKYKVNVRDEALDKKLEELKNRPPGKRGPRMRHHPSISPGTKPTPEKEAP